MNMVDRLYRTASLKEVNIGFGGRLQQDTAWYHALYSAQTGDGIRLAAHTNPSSQGWRLLDKRGGVVGTMSRAFVPPEGHVCEEARIAWIIARRHDPVQPSKYAAPLREEWPVVVPEFVFRPFHRTAA
jgi:hypothetical protein